MEREIITLGQCTFEICKKEDEFLGIGVIEIGNTRARSGRLPLSPYTQTFSGHSLRKLQLLNIFQSAGEIRIKLRALFNPLPVKLMRDHSFDPIHDTGDWDSQSITGEGALDLVLTSVMEDYFGYTFTGFSYHYEYASEQTEIFYLYDRASWELDGDIDGATVYSQSSCSSPVVKCQKDTRWSTEGRLFWIDEASGANPVMTHNLPRWASHQCFDFQFKENATLLGVFEKVDLIRSVLQKDDNKPELKTFDKHIFDQTLCYSTTPKKILLNRTAKTATDQKNLWTWLLQELHDRARDEYGLTEESFVPRVYVNYWKDFTIDTYYKDILPAAKNIGVRAVFIDNVFKSDMSEGLFARNMCCGHAYEPAPSLGGTPKLKAFVEDCRALGIRPYSWTNNDQSLASPLNASERDEKGWFLKMEDTRTKFGGAYTNVMSFLNFKNEDARQYFVSCKKKIKDETGMNAFLFDSFYNAAFMPMNYGGSRPSVMWREVLCALKELQDTDIHFMIESFGPFGEVQHGCPTSYNLENLFACYKIVMGTGYTTIPSGNEAAKSEPWPFPEFYRILSYMSSPGYSLFYDGVRIDKLFSYAHKRAIQDYYECLPLMSRRYLQEDEKCVIWKSKNNKESVIWNYTPKTLSLAGHVTDVTAGKALAGEKLYHLEAGHTYKITEGEDL